MDERAVGGDRKRRDRRKRKKPGAIIPVQMDGTGPDGFLVEGDILEQRKPDITWRKVVRATQLPNTLALRQGLAFISARILGVSSSGN